MCTVMCFNMYFKISFIYCFMLIFSSTLGLEKNDENSYQISNFTDENVTHCFREHAYDKLDVKEVLGKWKILEVYMHLSNEGVKTFTVCPDVTIWETEEFPMTTFGPSTENQLYHVQHINAKFRQEYRHLRLLWDEAGQTTEYSLYFRNDSAGYWQVFNGQNGTLTTRQEYQQFGGSIQVLKAVNDHLVLNFCQEAINGRPAQLYTVLFSRDPGQMARWELESVHTMLQNKKLSVASRRMVCGNNAGRPFYSLVLSIFLVVVSYAIAA